MPEGDDTEAFQDTMSSFGREAPDRQHLDLSAWFFDDAVTAGHEGVMVGKTFKDLTDEMLRWQTQHLKALEVATEDHTVWVRPELVVEIALDGAQRSTRYPAGLALRFARLKAHRPDKTAAEIERLNTLETPL